ncbi:MAG: S24 family peptidase [Gammaproteobacteria bacterium]|nr:S24 family peptidase [Gammaproteobacteria bacterium]
MMRKVSEIRLKNLETLIEEAGSATQLARVASTNGSYLSQLRHQFPAPNGNPRGIGNELAGKLERAMNKPSGWLDVLHEEGDASGKKTAATIPGNRRLLPLISWVQAGNWQEISEAHTSDYEADLLSCPIRCSPESFVLRVRGASMQPRFNEGDLIFVDPNVAPDHGKFVVVRLTESNEATFKQLMIEDGKHYLKAINPDWPQRIIEVNEEAIICGVIVFKGEVI